MPLNVIIGYSGILVDDAEIQSQDEWKKSHSPSAAKNQYTLSVPEKEQELEIDLSRMGCAKPAATGCKPLNCSASRP